jgi:hypothetical protein
MVSPMKLLPSWEMRLQDVKPVPIVMPIEYGLKKSIQYYAMKTHFVDNLKAGRDMLDFAMQRPISHIGFDTEFRYDRL